MIWAQRDLKRFNSSLVAPLHPPLSSAVVGEGRSPRRDEVAVLLGGHCALQGASPAPPQPHSSSACPPAGLLSPSRGGESPARLPQLGRSALGIGDPQGPASHRAAWVRTHGCLWEPCGQIRGRKMQQCLHVSPFQQRPCLCFLRGQGWRSVHRPEEVQMSPVSHEEPGLL